MQTYSNCALFQSTNIQIVWTEQIKAEETGTICNKNC
jgi:hypothetical protein